MQERSLENFDLAEGQVLLVDKPTGWSSFHIVNVIKRITKAKVGHAGTLDPLATGLLVLCTGKMTKTITQYIEDDKEYETTFYIGATTPTFDREQDVDQTWDISHITDDQVRQAVKELTGDIEQIPPIYSAIKTNGKEAFKMARKGHDVVMQPRQVTVSEFEILKIELPKVYCRITCSKGTYIRSLARDLGEKLGVGGYMYELRRTRSGNFKLADAWNLDSLCKYLIANKPLILQHARSDKRK